MESLDPHSLLKDSLSQTSELSLTFNAKDNHAGVFILTGDECFSGFNQGMPRLNNLLRRVQIFTNKNVNKATFSRLVLLSHGEPPRFSTMWTPAPT